MAISLLSLASPRAHSCRAKGEPIHLILSKPLPGEVETAISDLRGRGRLLITSYCKKNREINNKSLATTDGLKY